MARNGHCPHGRSSLFCPNPSLMTGEDAKPDFPYCPEVRAMPRDIRPAISKARWSLRIMKSHLAYPIRGKTKSHFTQRLAPSQGKEKGMESTSCPARDSLEHRERGGCAVLHSWRSHRD